jgi:hypothetical protein
MAYPQVGHEETPLDIRGSHQHTITEVLLETVFSTVVRAEAL